jgi:transcriptional regulator of met regulon
MKSYTGIIRLICLLVVAPLLIWALSISKTVELYGETNKIKQMNGNSSTVNAQEEEVKGTTVTPPLLSNGKLLQLLADSLTRKKVRTMGYAPEMIRSEEGCNLFLGKWTLAGGYIDLVQSLHAQEQMELPVKVAAVSFEYDRKRRDAPKEVTCRLLLEQMEQP